MNRLSLEQRATLIGMMVEGTSLRATTRLSGVSINTVTKLLVDVGTAGQKYHDEHVRNLRTQRVQADEIWSFVYAEAKNVSEDMRARGVGDVWTWTAMDVDSKLMISYLVGGRDAGYAYEFIQEVASRLTNGVQLTTKDHKAYLEAVDGVFGIEVDYAELVKMYGTEQLPNEFRYSPPEYLGAGPTKIMGNSDEAHISTSYIERNLALKMINRGFTGSTNAFSKKIENHKHSIALHFMHYNFCQVHESLRITPAMEAGISNHVWSLEELAGLVN